VWRALIFLVLSCPVLGQTPVVRVVSEEAEQHLLKRVPPVYPPLAQQVRISGVVILEISIDESGTPSVRRIIYGHPLLQYAAMNAVRSWTYQPFESGGKPVRVITFVMAPFGATRRREDEGRNEMLFQHNFWSAEEAAETALRQGDETGAAQQLSRASALLAAGTGFSHDDEKAQWMTDMGELSSAQKKYDDAEDYYKKAVKVHQDADKESLGAAAALANLGHFYAEEKKYDLAREHGSKSVSIYKKHFKAVGSEDSKAQQTYGNVIARLSWMLSKIAVEQNNHSEAAKQCRTVLDFQKFLDPSEQSSFIPTCQQTLSGLSKN
jgi:TonB family protein